MFGRFTLRLLKYESPQICQKMRRKSPWRRGRVEIDFPRCEEDMVNKEGAPKRPRPEAASLRMEMGKMHSRDPDTSSVDKKHSSRPDLGRPMENGGSSDSADGGVQMPAGKNNRAPPKSDSPRKKKHPVQKNDRPEGACESGQKDEKGRRKVRG